MNNKSAAHTFTIGQNDFYLDGKPFKIISGAIHYFRTVPEYWQDRLEKLVNIGCNTVETYIPWNFHEPKRGEFLWEGMHDICRFIELAQNLGLYIIIRPSPYICSEWELGGLPAWLLKDRNMRLRCSYKPYLDEVKRYYSQLMPKLAAYQIDRGGKIILMQIENEYGYFGNDKVYLEFLRDTMREFGITVPFVTSDGPWNKQGFKAGSVDGALATGNFGSGAEWQFGKMSEYMGSDKPLMCMEFWNGWFDAWGDNHHTTSPENAAHELDELLKRGSINFYMFEGGTNFGFMNGRNAGSKTADVTSYDYDAPLTEDGRITQKYLACKEVILKYTDIKTVPLTTEIKRHGYGTVKCCGKVGLLDILGRISTPIKSSYPMSMEESGQSYGYILYRAKLAENEPLNDIRLDNVFDRVQCYVDGKHMFTAFADNLYDTFKPQTTSVGSEIDLLCENIGRENFGMGLENQRKGVVGGVIINGHRHYGYEIYPLELEQRQLEKIAFTDSCPEGVPAFYKFDFTVDEACDTFLDTSGFAKGCAFINGFNLGRFWEIGPQKRLYIPAPLLRKGTNTIIIFETEGIAHDSVTLCDEPRLG